MLLTKNNLRYDINSICAFDDISKTGFFEIISKMSNATEAPTSIRFSDIRNLIFAGLLHQDPNLTITDAGNIMDEFIQENSFDQLVEMLGASLIECNIFGKAKPVKNVAPGRGRPKKELPQPIPEESENG